MALEGQLTRAMAISTLIMGWSILRLRISGGHFGMQRMCGIFPAQKHAQHCLTLSQMSFIQATPTAGENLPVPVSETAVQSAKLPVLSAQEPQTLQKIRLTSMSKVPNV